MSEKRAVLAINAWSLVSDAVEKGLRYGWYRVFKYREKPTGISDTAVEELMDSIRKLIDEEVVSSRSSSIFYKLSKLVKEFIEPYKNGLPEDEVIVDEVLHAVMNDLSDSIDFDRSGVADVPDEGNDTVLVHDDDHT